MNNDQRTIAFGSAAEIGTGLGLIISPRFVIGLLLGAEPTGIALTISRVAGIALMSLGISCWPGRGGRESYIPTVGLLVYNTLATLYLAKVGLTGGPSGILLWPAILLHLTFAVLLAFVCFRSGPDNRAGTAPAAS